jgi:nucleobase:cation symporter-1, NCS1 family
MASEKVHPDGRVELSSHDEISASPLYNHDLAPVRIAQRTWNTWDYAALWVSMAHCIPTYMMASSMIKGGMSWWQALATILLGNLIVLVPILLNSHPGTKYGIPFPVFARAAYGTTGANLPALMRALVACGWFGIQAWIGGKALQTFFVSLWPGWHDLLPVVRGYPGTQWISFLLFWALNILIVYRGMELLRRVERWAAPFVLVMTAVLVWWAVDRANGLGPIIHQPGRLDDAGAFFHVFVPALTGTVAFWSTLSLNMPDFTRYGRSQREQAIGQAVALPTTMTVFAAMGVAITSATAIMYGDAIWDPLDLAAKFHDRWIIAVLTFTVAIATLSVNIAANVVSPANDFANAFPKKIDFKTGGLITGVVGILMQPWALLEDEATYIGKWLVGYGAGLGSIAGVLIVDYWILRKRELSLRDLYLPDGKYRYTNGWNMDAVWATLIGSAVAFMGAFVPAMRPIYDWSWFIGFGLAGGLYYALSARRAR